MGMASVRNPGRLSPSSPEAVSRPCDPAEIDRSPHAIERQVQRVLTSHPGLNVSNLVVRRVGEGVCLSGIVETLDGKTDVCDLAKQVRGVNEVLNRLIVQTASSPREVTP